MPSKSSTACIASRKSCQSRWCLVAAGEMKAATTAFPVLVDPCESKFPNFAIRPALTLLHEVGHLLDHMALNPLKGTFGSDYDPAFERLWECWRKSCAVRHLNTLATRKRPIVPQEIRRFLLYQVRASELWARTYAQWIALRSNDLLLASQLRSAREHDPYTQWTGQHFWEHTRNGRGNIFGKTTTLWV
jgi:hypothetical protein